MRGNGSAIPRGGMDPMFVTDEPYPSLDRRMPGAAIAAAGTEETL